MNTKLGLFTQILKSSFYFLWSNRLVPILQVYERIRELHQAAFLLGEDTRVEYPHKMKVDIEISSGATPIPLTRNTDFNGCTFCVEPAKYQL